MARAFHELQRQAEADTRTPSSGVRTRDISALAWTLLLVGFAALAGALVLPARPAMLAPIAGALALVGLGLLHRAPWSRTAAIALFVALIHGQLTRRWLESDLLSPFVDAVRGVHEAGANDASALLTVSGAASTLGLAGAVCGALLCVAMGGFVIRLASHAVRGEFRTPQPAQARRPSSTSPSR